MRCYTQRDETLIVKEAWLCLAVLLGAALAVLAFTGCRAPEQYASTADQEAYSVIAENRQAAVQEAPKNFSVEPPERNVLRQIPRKPDARQPAEKEPYLDGDGAHGVRPPKQMDLATAMKLAAVNSRDFQDRREAVFLSALSLTLQRDRFTPRFFGTVAGSLAHEENDNETASAESNFGLNRLLQTGGEVSLEFSTILTEYLTGDPREAASSLINLTFTQPLLRGRGISATEPLTQAQQNLIYEMRRFVRFRRTFFTQVYSEYFDVLQQRQVVRNEKLNLENLRRARKRAEAMFDAGRLPGFQVDQTRQDELRAEDRLERAQQRYHRTLDQFKSIMGVKPDINLVLDMTELQEMEDPKAPDLPWTREKAIEIALANRLDLKTARDRVADARRKIQVAVNNLKPGLDLTLETGSATSGDTKPVNFSTENDTYTAGMDLDLPLERTEERNRYRERLIELQAAKRQAEETRDQVINAGRQAWRNYFRAWESYRIQRNSVDLAQERVDSTTMLLNAGRASTRDMLEARESLIQAQNGLSQALVDYRVARLNLSRDLGILTMTDSHTLEDNFDYYPKTQPAEPEANE